MKYCIVLVLRRVSKLPVRKHLEHGCSGHDKGAFPGETGLLKMVPADVPNGKLCFFSSTCFTFNTSSKFSQPYLCFACHFCIINQGHPSQFSENICSEDDLRTRIFGTFCIKFLGCLPFLGFSNILKVVQLPIFNGFLP